MEALNENKKRGIIGTVVFHRVLLIIFLFTGLKIPLPFPPEEKGLPVQLDLGNVDFGSGEEQPQSTQTPDVTEPITEPEPVESSPVEAPEDVATQEEVSDMSVPEKTEAKEPEKKKPELDERLKRVLSNPFQTNTDNTSKGQGDSKQPGDHGKPEGSPEGSSLHGDKSGGGISYSLGGRGFRGAPPIQGNMQESGKIVVDIIVDRAGNVIRVTPGSRGTTITNAELIKKAMESARQAKFTPKADAPEEQKGTITFDFILE